MTKATSARLAAQEREFNKNLTKAEEKLSKVIKKHGKNSEKTSNAVAVRNLNEHGYEVKKKRCTKVREAKKELGRIHHPINSAKEADLSSKCRKRLAKARRSFDLIVNYVTYFFVLYKRLCERS